MMEWEWSVADDETVRQRHLELGPKLPWLLIAHADSGDDEAEKLLLSICDMMMAGSEPVHPKIRSWLLRRAKVGRPKKPHANKLSGHEKVRQGLVAHAAFMAKQKYGAKEKPGPNHPYAFQMAADWAEKELGIHVSSETVRKWFNERRGTYANIKRFLNSPEARALLPEKPEK
ncbi:hypothetical protein FHS85_004916 [Rhodoligotrophos appendicifer]|uniref:hypothetical protein n=1 Tax=Rhodoligotrophos appendicifer TaxID=987056 RepID=UPI001185F345|nr:hypothetical protein [Rhodoligotrophos appendicifer]